MKYIEKLDHNHKDIINFEKIHCGSVWDSIDGNIKKQLKTILTNEQHNKCAYCEKKLVANLNNKNNTFCHIDHIKSRSRYKNETYKYDNVVVSCGHDYKNQKEDKNKHCGYTKKNYDIEKGFISPLSSDCSSHFKYSLNGKILSADKNKSDIAITTATIKYLNLNEPSLVDLRSVVIRLYDNEKKVELMGYLKNLKDSEPFYNCIRYILDDTIERLLEKEKKCHDLK